MQRVVIALVACFAALACATTASAAPSPPPYVWATVPTGTNEVTVEWSNAAFPRFELHRGTAPLFVPDDTTLVRRCDRSPCTDELSEPGAYHYRVISVDVGGVRSAASAAVAVTTSFDPAARPDIAFDSPAEGGTVSSLVQLEGGDPDGIADVELRVDGRVLPQHAQALPAALALDTSMLGNGEHVLTALARDSRGLVRSATRRVVVDNPRATGLVAAYGFDFDTGTSLAFDSGGSSNHGTVVGPAYTASGRYGKALAFDGVDDRVDMPALGTFYKRAFTLEAWVRPNAAPRDAAIAGSWSGGGAGGPMLWVSHLTGRYMQTLSGSPSQYLDSGRTPAVGQWQHVTATYDGERARFYVDGVQVAERTYIGDVGYADVWRIGAYRDSPTGFFNGSIDEVRVYKRPLTAAEVTTDAATPVRAAPQAPPAPPQLAGSGEVNAAKLSWNAADDVTGYELHRSATAGFTPTSATRIRQTGATSYTDAPLAAGTYYYRVVAGNEFGAGQASNEVGVDVVADTTPPTVSITEPVAGATLSRTVTISATAADAIALAGVRFEVDGTALGALDTSLPYRASWDTTTASNGAHTVTAVARDAAGNERPATVQVTVDNRVIGPGSPPIAAYRFDDGSGLIARDSSGNNRTGSLSGNPVWTSEGRHGGALTFDGYNDSVNLPQLGTFYRDGFTLEAWIKKRNDLGDMGIVGSWQSVYGEGGGVMLWVDHRNGRPMLAQGLASSLYLDSGIQPARDEWMHVAATSDGTTSELYVNGELAASGPAPEDLGNTNNWSIGRYGSSSANPFDGVIDDVKIYDRPLTAPEVRGDMNGDIGPEDTLPPTVPGDFAAGGVTATTIATSWTASSDAETGVARYALYRDGVEVGETTGTSYVFGNLACATGYDLAVEARDAAGNPSPRAMLHIETTPCRHVDGLVAAYAFDEGGGSTSFDASGNRNTAQIGGSWSPGRTGTALNGFATLPPLGTFYRDAFTLEAWVKPNMLAMAGDNAIVGTWVNAEGGGPMLWIDHVQTHYQLTLSRGMENYLDSGSTPSSQQWQHLAATYDGQTARVYVNGILAASRSFTGDVGTSNAWRIGTYGSGGYFHGLIDDVRIYSRALGGDEVRTDMQTPIGLGAS